MKTLFELESDFLQGKLSKSEYITQMYSLHDKLFEYANFIASRDIAEISITPNCVCLTTNALGLPTSCGGGVKLLLQRNCERITPLEILNFRFYEKVDSAMIVQLVENNSVVFDIGGNIGYYSIALSKCRQNLTIYAFEPVPSTYEQFVANVYYNGVQDYIQINNFGLFDKEGELTFYVYEQDIGNASAAIMHEEMDNKEVICNVTTLDSYVKKQNITGLDFIKCDVEGAEIFVLRGGIETIEKYKPILFVEMLRKWTSKYHYHPNDIIALLGKMGYECYYAVENTQQLYLERLYEMSEETVQTNFFFLHKQKHVKEIQNLSF